MENKEETKIYEIKKENNAKLYEALVKAQGETGIAKFDKVNPHFRNKYASFSSIMDACKKPLTKNGLTILQIIQTDEKGQMHLITRLAHVSGQFIESSFILRAEKNTIQGLGSAITYAKRYSLSSLLGIVADEDDDAEIAAKEEASYIKSDQVQELTKRIMLLENGDRTKVLKAIGTSQLGKVKADKYSSIIKLIDSTVKRNGDK